MCFPVQQSWYQMYRNFEEDPLLGGKSKCLKGTEAGEVVDDPTMATFEYSPDGMLNAKMKLMSSPGYTAKNVINVQPVDISDPGSSINLTISYHECGSCKVIRHSYIKEEIVRRSPVPVPSATTDVVCDHLASVASAGPHTLLLLYLASLPAHYVSTVAFVVVYPASAAGGSKMNAVVIPPMRVTMFPDTTQLPTRTQRGR
nr:uncharacterized protein LOC129382859 [Dermacentor andersoni]